MIIERKDVGEKYEWSHVDARKIRTTESIYAEGGWTA